MNVILVRKGLLDRAKKVSSKLHEGVSFLASKAKGLSNKIGDLWNKGKTKVKNDFIEADKAFRYAMKKWESMCRNLVEALSCNGRC
ncbi:hypothetical protein COE15_27765, partial [Bacillus cereus]